MKIRALVDFEVDEVEPDVVAFVCQQFEAMVDGSQVWMPHVQKMRVATWMHSDEQLYVMAEIPPLPGQGVSPGGVLTAVREVEDD